MCISTSVAHRVSVPGRRPERGLFHVAWPEYSEGIRTGWSRQTEPSNQQRPRTVRSLGAAWSLGRDLMPRPLHHVLEFFQCRGTCHPHSLLMPGKLSFSNSLFSWEARSALLSGSGSVTCSHSERI